MRGLTSIRKQLMLAFMALVSGVLCVIAVSVLLYERHSTRTAMDRNLSILTEMLALNTSGAVVFGDRDAATEMLEGLAAEPSVLGAELRSQSGDLIAAYRREDVGLFHPKSDMVGGSVFEDGLFHVARPIEVHGQVHGYLRLVSDLSLVRAEMRRILTLVLALLVATLTIAYFSAQRVRTALVEPLMAVARTTDQISRERDYSLRVPVSDTDEIARLVDGINHMLHQIQEQDSELRHSRDQLEERVQERTLELTIAKDAAEEAVRVKSEFLANISHELRTPMHAILSFADLGKTRLSKGNHAKVAQYLVHIKDAGTRLLGLLNELLDLSRLEAGKMKFEFATCDLAPVIRHAVDEMRSTFSKRHLYFHIDGPDSLPLVADEGRLVQVLQNILANASRFTPEQSSVWIEFEQRGNLARVKIRDQGPGIPEKDLDRIFHQFEQSSITKTGAGGTGLGLAICREIMHAHLGTIEASNSPEGGAIFTVEVPTTLKPSSPPSGSSRSLKASTKRPRSTPVSEPEPLVKS